MRGNNKKKSSPEKQCDGYSRCIKRYFLSMDKCMAAKNLPLEGRAPLEICPIIRRNRLFIGRIVQNVSDRTFYAIF
ncbi:hypothetical protein EVY00_24375 [Citrobacter werkmanii]|nr:hypothetical protein F0329_16865 [Citrobacter werkmanii]RYH93422.1 hypothetical protein EVY00_24375 [Citrobacter werkmanii]